MFGRELISIIFFIEVFGFLNVVIEVGWKFIGLEGSCE